MATAQPKSPKPLPRHKQGADQRPDASLILQASQIIRLDPRLLKPHPRNARTHSNKQISQIKKSIKAFGFLTPVLIDQDNLIIAGHARTLAAKDLGLTSLPCLRVGHLTSQEIRAYMLADNKLAENAGWDQDLLADEIHELSLTLPEIDFDAMGFTIAETDALIAGIKPNEDGDPADDILPLEKQCPAWVNKGDLWGLGEHRLLCGDSRDQSMIEALLNGQRAQMVFTDPPYNVPVRGNIGGLGKVQHKEFAMASGEMTPKQFTDFLRQVFQVLVNSSLNGSIHFICMDWRHIEEVQTAARPLYAELKNLIIWVKDNGGMGSFYRSRHELIFAFKNGDAPHINTFELGQHGRYRTNVWEYRGVNTLKKDRMKELELHPTVKPVQMIADAIKDVSSRGGIVLDLFGGSGSTLIAAHKTGRRGYLCEIDQVYCDRILARWEHYAKDEAILLACGWEASKPGPLPQSTGEQETDQSLQVKERDHAG